MTRRNRIETVRSGRTRRAVCHTAREDYCGQIAKLAVRALLYEVCIAPKPGLVDRLNNGAHRDMNLFTFLDSACALSGYFREITAQAMRLRRIPPERLLPHLRAPGKKAEREMFRATGGVNTHKGIVYSMGIFCAACGLLYDQPRRVPMERLFSLCAEIACGDHPQKEKMETNGERLYRQYRIEGVRGEAANGFPSARLHGLPALRRANAFGWDIDAAGIYTLFHIMAHLEDTNLISRSDLKTQRQVREQLVALLQTPGLSPAMLLSEAARMDQEFIRKNISPGGAADMLSMTLMAWWLEQEFPERFGGSALALSERK
ncbi:triphosphoribosyl-dephospho-CoA synthase [Faecalispora anaeroviscerum]|uniref:triphosphoribosyl-dephospho-CoA synthase n=1 Tax=Faecalispora anaeroviscerum TaxID=2991836 RepID=UPI0024B9219D|nr:triphosphoribosyl-dephospho-CoA synthase [Faecalispora anaeroviscerum]